MKTMGEHTSQLMEALFQKALDQKTVRGLRKDIDKLSPDLKSVLAGEVTLRLKECLLDNRVWALNAVTLFSDSSEILQQCLNSCIEEILTSCLAALQCFELSVKRVSSAFHVASKALYIVLQKITNLKFSYQENDISTGQLKEIFTILVKAIIDDSLPSECALIIVTDLCLVFTYLVKCNKPLKFLHLLKIIGNLQCSNENIPLLLEELFQRDSRDESDGKDIERTKIEKILPEITYISLEEIRISYPVLLTIQGLLNGGVSWLYIIHFNDSDTGTSYSSSLKSRTKSTNEDSTELIMKNETANTDMQVNLNDKIQCRSSEVVHSKFMRVGHAYNSQILYLLFPLIRKFCCSLLSHCFQAFQVLQSWLQCVRKLLQRLKGSSAESFGFSYENYFPSKLDIFEVRSVSSDTVFHLLNSYWESPAKGVSDVVYSCMSELLQLHDDENPGQAEVIAMHMIVSLVHSNGWKSKSTYPLLALSITYVGAGMVLQRYPSIPSRLAESLSVNYLAPPGTNVYKIILSQLPMSVWKTHFFTVFVDALHSTDKMSRQNALMLWLPVTIRQYPDIWTHLIGFCHSSNEGLIVKMTTMRIARMNGLIDLNENIEINVKENMKYGLKENVTVDDGNIPVVVQKLPEDICDSKHLSSIISHLHHAVSCIDESIRSEALGFLCHTKKASEPVSSLEAELLKEFFALNMNVDSAPFRQNIIRCYKAVMIRLRDACFSELRKLLSKTTLSRDILTEDILKSCEEKSVLMVNGDLLLWFLSTFHRNLIPDGNYQRRILSLRLYKETLLAYFEVTNSGYERIERFSPLHIFLSNFPQNHSLLETTPVTPQPVTDLMLPWTTDMLFFCCLDEMNDIREEAESILCILSSKLKIRGSEIGNWLLHGFALCNSPKAGDAESGASLIKVVTSLAESRNMDVRAVLQSCDLSNDCQSFHEYLFRCVEKQFSEARESLLVAARCRPLHGSLLALGRYLCENYSKRSVASENISELLNRLLDVMTEIVEYMLSSLSLSSKDGSAVAPSFADMGESIDMIIKECNKNINAASLVGSGKIEKGDAVLDEYLLLNPCINDEEADESCEADTAISGDHALILSCCWRSLKVCCLVSSMCASQWLNLMNEKQVERMLKSIVVRVLTGTRHKGAIEAARTSYGQLCSLLLCNKSRFGHVICNQVEDILNQLKCGTQASVTRRAAGMAMMIQVACGTVPRTNKLLIDHTVTTLMNIAQTEYEVQSTVDSPPVLAVHILHSLVIYASLAHHIFQHMPAITMMCLQAFTSDSWALRNAALQLYGAVVPRMIGQKKVRDDSSTVNSLTACEFMSRHPKLTDHLLQLLQNVKSSNDFDLYEDLGLNVNEKSSVDLCFSIKASSYLVPVLSLLARLSPGTALQQSAELSKVLRQYRTVTLRHLGSSMHTVRRLASISVFALTPTEEVPQMIDILIGCLKSEQMANRCHGMLLSLKVFLETYSVYLEDLCLRKNVFSVMYSFLERGNTCYINANLAVRIMELYSPNDLSVTIPSGDNSNPGASQFLLTCVKGNLKRFSQSELESFIINEIFTQSDIELHFLELLQSHLNECKSLQWMENLEGIIFDKLENINVSSVLALVSILSIILNKQSCIKVIVSGISVKNLMTLLHSSYGSKMASEVLIVIAYMIKDLYSERLSEVTLKKELISAFSSEIEKYSDPTSTEEFRFAASEALDICMCSVLDFSFNIDEESFEKLLTACIKLLQDENADIRDSASNIVFGVQSKFSQKTTLLEEVVDRSRLEVVHPNLALKHFIDIVVDTSLSTRSWLVLRCLWKSCFLDKIFVFTSKTELFLFQSQAVNLYEEPTHLSYHVAEAIERAFCKYWSVSEVNSDSEAHEKNVATNWLQSESESLNMHFIKLKALLKERKHLTDKKLIIAISIYITAFKLLLKVSRFLNVPLRVSCPFSWDPDSFCILIYSDN